MKKYITYAFATSQNAEKYNYGNECYLVYGYSQAIPHVYQVIQKQEAWAKFESINMEIDTFNSFTKEQFFT